MPGEVTTSTTATTAGDAGESANAATVEGNAATSAAKPNEGAGQAERSFTQAELDRIIKDRLAQAQAAADKKAAEATAAAEAAKLTEQGEFKKLYEEEKVKRETAEAREATEKRERMLDRIAVKHQLPETLRDRLQGETEAEIEADAAELAKLVVAEKRPQAPNTNSQAGGKGGNRYDKIREEVSSRQAANAPAARDLARAGIQ